MVKYNWYRTHQVYKMVGAIQINTFVKNIAMPLAIGFKI